MILRVIFVLMGLFTAAPQVWFLLLSYHYFPSRDVPKEWWSGVTLRLVSLYFLASGAWLFFVNSSYINEPLKYSWGDTVTTIFMTSLGAVASGVFLGNYMRYRNWDA